MKRAAWSVAAIAVAALVLGFLAAKTLDGAELASAHQETATAKQETANANQERDDWKNKAEAKTSAATAAPTVSASPNKPDDPKPRRFPSRQPKPQPSVSGCNDSGGHNEGTNQTCRFDVGGAVGE